VRYIHIQCMYIHTYIDLCERVTHTHTQARMAEKEITRQKGKDRKTERRTPFANPLLQQNTKRPNVNASLKRGCPSRAFFCAHLMPGRHAWWPGVIQKSTLLNEAEQTMRSPEEDKLAGFTPRAYLSMRALFS